MDDGGKPPPRYGGGESMGSRKTNWKNPSGGNGVVFVNGKRTGEICKKAKKLIGNCRLGDALVLSFLSFCLLYRAVISNDCDFTLVYVCLYLQKCTRSCLGVDELIRFLCATVA